LIPLGNMVVSSAIADFNLNVNSYFALDAAVATEAYDGINTNLDMVMETKDASNNSIWPQARLGNGNLRNRWLHNDFEEVSYPFVYPLYQTIVGLGES